MLERRMLLETGIQVKRGRCTMSNISVKKDNGSALPARMTEWDPFRAARDLLRWDPFREMAPFGLTNEGAVFSPAFEVKETKDSYLFKADMPGVKEQDLDITRTGNRLTVSGKRDAEKEEKAETYYTYERTYGTFTRAFTLPEGIDGDHIHADLKDGVLTLVVPKTPEAQPKKISLKGLFEKKS
jgi:HSP20 family protein